MSRYLGLSKSLGGSSTLDAISADALTHVFTYAMITGVGNRVFTVLRVYGYRGDLAII